MAKQENNDVSSEKDSLRAQLEQIKRKVDDLVNIEIVNHKERIRVLENELCAQKDQNTELEDRFESIIKFGIEVKVYIQGKMFVFIL